MRLPNQSQATRPTYTASQAPGRGISPSMIRLPPNVGCGACTELNWPGGGRTGSCVQECCDVLGSCTFRACACPTSGGFGGFGRGGNALLLE